MLTEPSNLALGTLNRSEHCQSALFCRACRQLDSTGDLEQALLLTAEGMTVCEMGVRSELAAEVAARARPDWNPSQCTVQIQYMHFDDNDEPLVLYLKPVGDSLIILVAGSAVLLSKLRRIADLLARILSGRAGIPDNSKKFTLESFVQSEVEVDGAYAIAWRTVEPLPDALREIVRDSAQRLARRKGCQLSFVGVASDHVHLVLQCPPSWPGSRAAYIFKNGIEEDVARRFGISATLWQKGFLADASLKPISGEALLAYLNS